MRAHKLGEGMAMSARKRASTGLLPASKKMGHGRKSSGLDGVVQSKVAGADAIEMEAEHRVGMEAGEAERLEIQTESSEEELVGNGLAESGDESYSSEEEEGVQEEDEEDDEEQEEEEKEEEEEQEEEEKQEEEQDEAEVEAEAEEEDEKESEEEASSVSDHSDESEGEETDRAADTTAFGRAFAKIMKKKLPDSSIMDVTGPVLSAHKKLISKKLEEEASDRKTKTEVKREKQAIREKGHTIPVSYIDAKEKSLIKLATKGVVKLFNAVSKAQSVQPEAKVSKISQARDVAKQRKAKFLAELQGVQSSGVNIGTTVEEADGEKPSWSVLQDTFIFGKSRLKDWDKKEDLDAGDGSGESSDGGSFSG